MLKRLKTQTLVLGGGPAGYSAAFRCADLGIDTVIVERYHQLGGVCLNVGCIPSKAFLNIVKNVEKINDLKDQGVFFKEPSFNLEKMRHWKEKIINRLSTGLANMARTRKVTVITGKGKFITPNVLEVEKRSEKILIDFKNAIISSGSSPSRIPALTCEDSRIWYSTDALLLQYIPKNMLVIGGGAIGLEMSTIYCALGTKIDIVEENINILPDADEDIVKIFLKNLKKINKIYTRSKIVSVEPKKNGIYVSIEKKEKDITVECYDRILVAAGRLPNSQHLNLNQIGVKTDNFGFIKVDNQLRTSMENIFAVGDVAGPPMLAHKGIQEGHIAAEVISGMRSFFDSIAIPAITYTDPEVGWVGLTEKIARVKNIKYEVANFPWNASGRAIACNCTQGVTKLIFNMHTRKVIGGAVVGSNGGELLGQIGLGIEMGCDAEDIALTMHAHPTLYESIGLAAQVFTGSITDLINTKAKV